MKQSLLFLMGILTFFNLYPSSELFLTMKDGSINSIPFDSEILLIPDNDNLTVRTEDQEIQIPLNDIKSFDTDISTLSEIESEEFPYYIYTLDGMLIGTGVGVVKNENLELGRVYIVKRKNLTYKFIPQRF